MKATRWEDRDEALTCLSDFRRSRGDGAARITYVSKVMGVSRIADLGFSNTNTAYELKYSEKVKFWFET